MIKIKFKTIDSTHKYALEMISKNKAMECVIIADEQTDGVGRGERSWLSVKGNLFASLLLNTANYRFENFGHLSLLIACAVRDSIAEYLNDESQLTLHWPNDVYYNSRKISGILLAKLDNWVIVSVGLNINSVPNLKTAVSMTELKSFGVMNDRVPSSSEILDCFLDNFRNWMKNFRDSGFSNVKQYWLRHTKEVGEKVIIKNGNEFLTGTFRDIDDYGRLVLENGETRFCVSTGDMFLNPKGIKKEYD